MLALRPAGPVRGLLGQVVRSHPEAVVDAVVQTVPDMLGAAGRDLGELDLPRGRVLDLQVVLLDGGTAVDRCLPGGRQAGVAALDGGWWRRLRSGGRGGGGRGGGGVRVSAEARGAH